MLASIPFCGEHLFTYSLYAYKLMYIDFFCLRTKVYCVCTYAGIQIPARASASASASVGISSGDMSKQMPMRRYSNFGNSTAAIAAAAAAAAATAGSQPTAAGASSSSSSSAPLTSLQPFSSSRVNAVSVCMQRGYCVCSIN